MLLRLPDMPGAPVGGSLVNSVRFGQIGASMRIIVASQTGMLFVLAAPSHIVGANPLGTNADILSMPPRLPDPVFRCSCVSLHPMFANSFVSPNACLIAIVMA